MAISPSRSPLDAESLDARIVRAEHRLMAREQRLRDGLGTLAGRARAALRPPRLLWPLAGAAVAGTALWALARRRRAGPVVAGPASTAYAPRHGDSGAPWMSLLALLWPLLPARWRDRVSPATAGTTLGLVLPLLQRALVGRRLPPLPTAAQVDLGRFAGRWHELARLPTLRERARPPGQPRTDWQLQADGDLQLTRHWPGREGDASAAHGTARPVPGSRGARLRLSFLPPSLRWLPGGQDDVCVLHVDDAYREALLGTPDRRGLWLMARRRVLAPERVRALLEIARAQGFAVDRLQWPDGRAEPAP